MKTWPPVISSVDASTSTTSTRGSSAASSSRTRETPSRSRFIRVAWQLQADHRPLERATSALQRSVIGLLHERAAPLAARKLVARRAREELRSSSTVQDAHRASTLIDGAVQRGGQRLGQQPRTRRVVAWVHDLDDRPARTLHRSVRPHRRSRDRLGFERGGGAHQRERSAGLRRSLHRDVAAVPGRSPFLLERFVTLVEHDDRGEVRHRCPHRDPTADHHATPSARRGPGAASAPRRSRSPAARACGGRRARAACAARRAGSCRRRSRASSPTSRCGRPPGRAGHPRAARPTAPAGGAGAAPGRALAAPERALRSGATRRAA